MDESIRLLIIASIVPFVLLFFFSNPLRAAVYIIAFQKLIDIFWFAQIRIGPFPMSPQRILYTTIPIFLIIALLFLAQHKSRKVRTKFPTFLISLIVLFALWYFVNIFRAADLNYAIEGFTKVVGGYVMFFVGWLYFDGNHTEEKFDEFARLFVGTYLIPAAGVFLQALGIFQMSDIGVVQQTESNYGLEQKVRYPGFYNDAGTSAMYCWSAIPLALYLYSKQDQQHKWFYLFCLACMIMVVILGFARGSYLTLGVSLASWLFITKQHRYLMIGIIGLIIFFFTSDFLSKFFRDFVILFETGKFAPESISGKAAFWETLDELFEKGTPLEKLFGKGLGKSDVDIAKHWGREEATGESDFFSLRYNLGYFGWITMLLIPAVLIYRIFKSIKISRILANSSSLTLKYCVAFCIVCAWVVTMSGSGTKYVSVTFPMWFLVGFAMKHPAFYLSKMIENECRRSFLVAPKLSSHLS